MLSYPLWLALFAILPTGLLWLFGWKILVPQTRIALTAIIGALIVSVPWDYLSIRDGIWYFAEPHIIGVWFIGLPLEEWVFIGVVTLMFTSITVIAHHRYGA